MAKPFEHQKEGNLELTEAHGSADSDNPDDVDNNQRNRSPSTIEGDCDPLATPTTTLSLASDAETTSAPTVKNDEEKDIIDPTNAIETVCFDGDLLLNIRCSAGSADTVAPIILQLRVSSAVLRIVSTPLRKLLDTPAILQSSMEPTSTTRQSRHFIIHQPSGCDPRFWGYREGKGIFSLAVKSSIPVRQLKQAMLLVFKILHHDDAIRRCSSPTLLQVSWIAEIAWVLHCVGPVFPWIQSWLSFGGESSMIAVDAESRLVSGVILGFVFGDEEVFKNASHQWLFSHMTKTTEKWESLSLVVLTIIKADLKKKHVDLTRALCDTVSSTLTEYIQQDTSLSVVGALLRSLQVVSANGFEPHPNFSYDDPQVQVGFTWKLVGGDESIRAVISRFHTITSRFNYNLVLWDYNKVVVRFANKVVSEFEKLEGLKLADYRAPVPKMLDVDCCIGGIIVRKNWEIQELKKYGRGDYGGVLFWLAKLLVDNPEQLIRSLEDNGVPATFLGLQKLSGRMKVIWSWITTPPPSTNIENPKHIDPNVGEDTMSRYSENEYKDVTMPTPPVPHIDITSGGSQTTEEKLQDVLVAKRKGCLFWPYLVVFVCVLVFMVVGLSMNGSGTLGSWSNNNSTCGRWGCESNGEYRYCWTPWCI